MQQGSPYGPQYVGHPHRYGSHQQSQWYLEGSRKHSSHCLEIIPLQTKLFGHFGQLNTIWTIIKKMSYFDLIWHTEKKEKERDYSFPRQHSEFVWHEEKKFSVLSAGRQRTTAWYNLFSCSSRFLWLSLIRSLENMRRHYLQRQCFLLEDNMRHYPWKDHSLS